MILVCAGEMLINAQKREERLAPGRATWWAGEEGVGGIRGGAEAGWGGRELLLRN